MGEPIPVRVTRYRCPHCPRGHSTRRRAVEHIARCWHNPDVRGCKTCRHFERDFDGGEDCAVGVDLSGRPTCTHCKGSGFDPCSGYDSGEKCALCGGQPKEIKPGPIVGCDKWEAPGHEVSR